MIQTTYEIAEQPTYLVLNSDFNEEEHDTDKMEESSYSNEDNIDDENDLHEIQVDDDLNEPDADDVEPAEDVDLIGRTISEEEEED